MRKLIIEEWISLDGYVIDQHGKLDFFPENETNKFADKDQLTFLEDADTILLGRNTYDLFVNYWPTVTTDKEIIADRLNATPKVVFSNIMPEAPWGNWAPARVVTGNAIDHIRELKTLPGQNMVVWGSISLAQDIIKAGLADELHLQICPTTTGGGTRLFPAEENYRQFKLTYTKAYENGLVLLKYIPV